jgi:hypothetical protein
MNSLISYIAVIIRLNCVTNVIATGASRSVNIINISELNPAEA